MECKNMNKKKKKRIQEQIYKPKNAKEMHFFLLNVLNLILHNEYYCCYCYKKLLYQRAKA